MKYCITEGVEGYYIYHLSYKDKTTKSLCGKNTMQTAIPFEGWGFVGHLKERYCKECMDLSNLRFEKHG